MSENPSNLYSTMYDAGRKKLHEGFDYHQEDVIVKKTMMPRLMQNENVKRFLSYINNTMVNNIDAVKVIRNFFNYTVPKNDTKIN